MAQVHQARGHAPGDVHARRFSPTTRPARRPPSWPSTGRLPDAHRPGRDRAAAGRVQVLDQLRAAGCQDLRGDEPAAASSGSRPGRGRAAPRASTWRSPPMTRRADFPAPDLVLTAMMRTGTGAVQDVAVVHGTGAGVEAGRRSGAGVVAGVLTGPASARPAARGRRDQHPAQHRGPARPASRRRRGPCHGGPCYGGRRAGPGRAQRPGAEPTASPHPGAVAPA